MAVTPNLMHYGALAYFAITCLCLLFICWDDTTVFVVEDD